MKMDGDSTVRCEWAGADPLMVAYHDVEWCVPQHDDRVLFEFLTLEAAQAGLSWQTILRRREGYRQAFAGYDLAAIAAFGEDEVKNLLENPGIIRNRAKVLATIGNARAALEVKKEVGSLDAYLWQLVGGQPRKNSFSSLRELPAETEDSKAMSRALRMRGFSFVGPTICYAFMEAVGMVNDHVVSCFRYDQV
jgi:DNA-3-methyladenine glycosylase I